MHKKIKTAGSQRLNILMIAPQYRPLVGGYERAAERLSAALVARNHEVTVITERREQAWPAREQHAGVDIVRLWCIYRPKIHIATALTSFALFLLRYGRCYDVWHVHQYGQHATLAVALGKLLRRPVVLKLTSSGEQGLVKTTENNRFSTVTKALLTRISAVVTLTRETTREARAFGIPSQRIHQLGNGVDTLIYRPRASDERAQLKQSLRLPHYGIVVYVGRLSREKNPDGLLEAWRSAVAVLPPNWRLVIVGDGPLRAALEATIARECLGDSVSMVGMQHNVDEWLAASDIYVSSSHHEGLSNTMLEAMATGLPVVATRVSGVAELVEEPGAGAVVPVDDMAAFAAALIKLANADGLRAQAGETAKQVIERDYSIAAVAAKHEALYGRLTGKMDNYKE